MERRHGHTEACRRADGMSNGVGDVVKLEVEKDGAAPLLNGFDNRGPLRSEKLQADLADCRRLSEGIKQPEGAGCVGNIQGDDDFVLGSGREFHTMRRLKSDNQKVMTSISIAAPAKINLSLRILGKRPDGFHELETLMVPITLADEIGISHGGGSEIRLTCNDPDLPIGSENLCVKAAEAFRLATGLDHGIAISLLKKIPHGAGLGGGSSDAASVLLGLNQLFDEPLVLEEMHQIAATLGSDVPFFLSDGPAWCRGRGEILEAAPALPERRLLLIKPPFPVETAWAYKHYADLKSSAKPTVNETQWLGDLTITNDLESSVFDKFPLLPVMKSWLRRQSGVEAAFMTGSGSTMVAIIAPDAPAESVSRIRKDILLEFGPTFWMTETEWKNSG